MPELIVRRALLVLVAAGSLVAGGVVIRIAGDYTATAAPLTERPATAEQLTAEIDAERAAARALRDRLADVGGQINDLRGALGAMDERTGAEAEAAVRLAAELDAAEAKLAELERTLAATSGLVGNTATGAGELPRALRDLREASRSVRLLTDYLERHPEALLRGKSGEAN